MKKLFLSAVLALSMCMVFVLSGCSGGDSKLTSIDIDGTKITCHMDMAEVLSAFSEYEYEYSESISCAYNGLDKIYDYKDKGFTVYTYPDGDKDYVLEVVVYSEEISQEGGKVKVGMSQEDLESLYGTDYSKDGDALSYEVKDEQSMYFLVVDGEVLEYAISVAE